MFCTKCRNDLGDCTCPDIDARLASLANSPYIKLATCARCGKHVDRCSCAKEAAPS